MSQNRTTFERIEFCYNINNIITTTCARSVSRSNVINPSLDRFVKVACCSTAATTAYTYRYPRSAHRCCRRHNIIIFTEEEEVVMNDKRVFRKLTYCIPAAAIPFCRSPDPMTDAAAPQYDGKAV